MKKFLGLLAVGCMAGGAMAAPQVRMTNAGNSGNNNDGFGADLGPVFSGAEYTTFCVELAETFSYGNTYEYTISKSVKYLGSNQTLTLDDARGYAIARIFYTFSTQGEAGIAALSGVGGLTNEQYREIVQRTFWNKLYGGNQGGYSSQITQLWANATGAGAWTDLGNVRVMNLWLDADNETGAAQDMLVIIPLPSGAGLASLGLLGMAAARRRRA